MVTLAELWLPILLSSVFVFLMSSVFHMLIPLHKNDYKKLPGEDRVMKAMRDENIAPGQYFIPQCAGMKDMATPEMKAKYDEGPVGFMTIMRNGTPSMGKPLLHWFIFTVIMSLIAGYVATFVYDNTVGYHEIFRLTGTVAVVGYGVSHIPDAIWKGLSWGATSKFVFEGVVYGLLTGGTFGWLWPTI